MTTSRTGHYFLFLLLAGALLLTFFIFQPFLAPLVLAAAFAAILQPLYHRILRGMRNWPSVAALFTVIIAVVCLLVPLSLIGTQIGLQAANVSQDIVSPEGKAQLIGAIQETEKFVGRYIPAARGFSANLSQNIAGYAEAGLTWFVQHLGSAFTGVASFFLALFVFFVALYYLLRDGAALKAAVIRYSPLSDTNDETIFERLHLAVNSVVRGNLTIALIQGTLSGVGFFIFGVPNAVLWGAVTAIAALVPGLGTALVFTPIVIFMFVTGNTGAALGLTIWGVIAVGLIDNMLAPKLIGSGIQLHPLLVLLSVLGGITFFGPIGIFLGPISLSLLFAFLSIYSDSVRSEHR